MNLKLIFRSKIKLLFDVSLVLICTNVTGQVKTLSMDSLRIIWRATSREDVLNEVGFDKPKNDYGVQMYGRNKKTICTEGDSVHTTYNEFIFLDNDELRTTTYDRSQYIKSKTNIKNRHRYLGSYTLPIQNQKIDCYFDGTDYYEFYVSSKKML